MNPQDLAHVGEFEFGSVGLNERVHHPDCFAKYEAAFWMSRSSVVRLKDGVQNALGGGD